MGSTFVSHTVSSEHLDSGECLGCRHFDPWHLTNDHMWRGVHVVTYTHESGMLPQNDLYGHQGHPSMDPQFQVRSFVRMWMMNVVVFPVSMCVGFSPVSIVIISCSNTETWSLTVQGRGFKSCSLVVESSAVYEELIPHCILVFEGETNGIFPRCPLRDELTTFPWLRLR